MSCITTYLKKIIKFKMGENFAARMAKILNFIFVCFHITYVIIRFSVESFSITVNDVTFFAMTVEKSSRNRCKHTNPSRNVFFPFLRFNINKYSLRLRKFRKQNLYYIYDMFHKFQFFPHFTHLK